MISKISKERLTEWELLLIGCILYSASLIFVNRISVIPGSMLGIAVVANAVADLPIGLVNLLLNIPIMIVVTRKMGVKVLVYTIIIMVGTSLMIDLWTPYFPEIAIENVYAISVIGGAVMGIGAGMLIRAGGTMAGTTALTSLLQRKLTKVKFGTILFVMDCIIMLTGAAVLKDWKSIIYSAIYGFICAKMMDVVIYYKRGISSKNAD